MIPQGISWSAFETGLRRLSDKIIINKAAPVQHSAEHPELTLFGIWFGRKHICSVTFGEYVPYRDQFDEGGLLLRKGLKSILGQLLTAEFVPAEAATLNTPERFRGHYFKPDISLERMKKAFGVFRVEEIRH